MLSAGAPRLAGTGGMLRTGVIRHIDITYGLLHRTSGWQALMLSRWWAADARVEHMGARPNRAVVVKTALTCGCYSHSSTVFQSRRERIHNSLVTAIERLLVKRIERCSEKGGRTAVSQWGGPSERIHICRRAPTSLTTQPSFQLGSFSSGPIRLSESLTVSPGP